MKRAIKTILGLVMVSLLAFAILIIVLQVTDYKPDDVETIKVDNGIINQSVSLNTPLNIVTFNIGYSSLSAGEDFFMDGGTKSKPDSLDIVIGNYKDIQSTISSYDADFVILQEVDVNSSRSYALDMYQAFNQNMTNYAHSFAYNYKVVFVPVPWPPMGMVHAGQATYSKYLYDEASRIALPSDFAWPQNLVMLDRCVLVTTMPIEGSDQRLIVMNAHFSAYDDGSLRSQQLAIVKDLAETAYANGDYVILGGDFNQTFPMIDESQFPLYEEGRYYKPLAISEDYLSEGWQWGVDTEIPTYRLLNAPYEDGVTQVGIIDGFITSPNIVIHEVETQDLKFKSSDHNPVIMTFELVD